MPATIRDILRTLTADPGRPRLTWYGPDGERIELSGAVLDNWVSKTTNLLVEEFDAEPGTIVALDLPPHWRTLVWALAAWQAGAHVRVVDGPDATAGPLADVVVTATPDRWLGPDGRRPAHGDLVVVSLPALARRFDGELPPGAIDAASGVMTYADVVGYVAATDPQAPALTTADGAVTVAHRDLLSAARSARRPADEACGTLAGAERSRDLVRTHGGSTGTTALLLEALASWESDGSVVVLSPGVSAGLSDDTPRLDRLIETERVTRVPALAPPTAG